MKQILELMSGYKRFKYEKVNIDADRAITGVSLYVTDRLLTYGTGNLIYEKLNTENNY